MLLSALAPVALSGTLFLTNVRLFWHAQNQILLNVSVPFIEVIGLQVKAQTFSKDQGEEQAVLVQAASDKKTIVLAMKSFGVEPDILFETLQ